MLAAVKAYGSGKGIFGLGGADKHGADAEQSTQQQQRQQQQAKAGRCDTSSPSTSGEPSPSASACAPSASKDASLALLNRSPDASSLSRMRRNESAAAALQSLGAGEAEGSGGGAGERCGGRLPKNKSFAVLHQLRAREAEQPQTEASRSLVCEACAMHLEAMTKAEIPAGSPQPHVSTRAEMKEYIETICRQLNLPNSCIIAMVTYLERLVANDNFELTRLNWQPSVLSGFVVAAKLCFEEPVWNEDFLRALKISNVQVGQISRWEINFLKLISFETNIELSDYASLCFRLQERYLRTRGEKVQFFTFLMNACSAAKAG
mmetsp:Transcript_15023/g.48970  ORF Transcript_15023/g.48970 Transcript_15023/m.48970 type:complete len:320 (+) Transcript_15023:105-1064(+)